MNAFSEGSTQAFSDSAELQRRIKQNTGSGLSSSKQDCTTVTSTSSTPANLRVAELIDALKNANLTSLPNARLVFVCPRQPVSTDSTAISLPRSVSGWNMFGVVQPLDEVSSPIRLPFYDRPCDPATTRLIPLRLHCEIYYNPTKDDCVLVNKSYVDIYLTSLDSAVSRARLPYDETRVVEPGIWRILVETGSNKVEQHLVYFLVLRRQFTVAFRDSGRDSSLSVKRSAPGEEQLASKRQKSVTGVREVLLATSANAVRKMAEAVVTDAGTMPKPATASSGNIIRADSTSLLDLSDGTVAAVITAQVKDTEASSPSLAITSGGLPRAVNAATYTLGRLGRIANTPSASLFIVRHSALLAKAVAKVIKCNGDEGQRWVRCAMVCQREVVFLKALDHTNIVSLLAFDSRLHLIIVECLPPSLNRWTQSDFKPSDATKILRGLSSALAYLHDKEIHHNDIKPANITYSPLRGPVLIDFGLATSANEIMMTGGTPWYVPPDLIVEQQRGAPGDVWALGVTMLYVLRKIGLPEKTTKSWLIHEVNQKRDAREQMMKWLNIVARNREVLNCDDFVEGLVSQMLRPKRKQRIRFVQIAGAFEMPQK